MRRRYLVLALGLAAALAGLALFFAKDRIMSQPSATFSPDASPPAGIETVQGVVFPPGASGGRAAGESQWTLRFSLRPWRARGAALEETALSVSKSVSHDELRTLMGALPSYRIAAMRVRFSPPGHSRAELVAIQVATPSDPELEREALALQRPVTHDDPLFGTLTFNRDVSWWEGTATWQGRSVRLHIGAESGSDLEAALQTGRALWREQQTWDERIRAYAVHELLPLKNSSWLEEGEKQVTAALFEGRMTLDSVTVSPNGSFSFFHDDGGLFWGHAIEITGTLEDGPTHADIPG